MTRSQARRGGQGETIRARRAAPVPRRAAAQPLRCRSAPGARAVCGDVYFPRVFRSPLLAQWPLVALVASAALLLIEGVAEPRRNPPRRLPLRVIQRATEVLVLVFSALFILTSRFPSWIVQTAINPDEAQMTANALLVRAGQWTWSGVDGGTSGPANSIVLAWPYLFGMDATLSMTHVTSTMFLIAILTLT